MENKGLTLIGMPGSGKSTIGKIIAENLGRLFIDLDILIKERTGRSHAEILSEKGGRDFIRMEGNFAMEVNLAGIVFSPGGSIVYSDEAMKKIKNESKIIYLSLSVDEIRERLGGAADGRGIVGLKEKGLDVLFGERDALCRSYADEVLDCGGLSKNDIVGLLINKM